MARDVEAREKRIAERIEREARTRGEKPIDVAHATGVHYTTVERWFRAERFPQLNNRRDLARHWNLPLDSFEVDAEEKREADQLNRIEAKVDLLLGQAGLELPEGARDEDEPFPQDPLLEGGLREIVDRAEEDDELDEDKAAGS